MSTDSRCAPSSERLLHQRAAAWPKWPTLDELTAAHLRETSASEGIDFATALLYDRLRYSADHGAFIERIDALRQSPSSLPQLHDVTFAVAPGAFWKEYPHIQADGRLLRSVADECCCRTEMIPVPSSGPLQKNAETILDWLSRQPPTPIILTSLSKGGADVKLAMQQNPAAFEHVVAWINICGMLNGTPLVGHLMSKPVRRSLVRLHFWWSGLDFQMVRDLDSRADGLLIQPLALPEGVKLISVVGFPLVSHMHNWRSRMWRRALDPLGPNDGGVLLHDVCRLPGHVYPVWGADHYLQPRQFDVGRLAAALLQYIVEERTELNEPAEHVALQTDVR